jgi:type II secretory pathway component PulJ
MSLLIVAAVAVLAAGIIVTLVRRRRRRTGPDAVMERARRAMAGLEKDHRKNARGTIGGGSGSTSDVLSTMYVHQSGHLGSW